MQQSNILSPELLSRIRVLALQKVALMDELEAALLAEDNARIVELARLIVGIEKEVVKQ